MKQLSSLLISFEYPSKLEQQLANQEISPWKDCQKRHDYLNTDEKKQLYKDNDPLSKNIINRGLAENYIEILLHLGMGEPEALPLFIQVLHGGIGVNSNPDLAEQLNNKQSNLRIKLDKIMTKHKTEIVNSESFSFKEAVKFFLPIEKLILKKTGFSCINAVREEVRESLFPEELFSQEDSLFSKVSLFQYVKELENPKEVVHIKFLRDPIRLNFKINFPQDWSYDYRDSVRQQLNTQYNMKLLDKNDRPSLPIEGNVKNIPHFLWYWGLGNFDALPVIIDSYTNGKGVTKQLTLATIACAMHLKRDNTTECSKIPTSKQLLTIADKLIEQILENAKELQIMQAIGYYPTKADIIAFFKLVDNIVKKGINLSYCEYILHEPTKDLVKCIELTGETEATTSIISESACAIT